MCLGLCIPTGTSAQEPPADPTPNSDAHLVSEVRDVAPGGVFTAALVIDLDDGWHTYWRNPGDSGSEAVLDWHLPEGFQAGPVQWPVPERVPTGPLVSYAYHGRVLLLTDIAVPARARPGTKAHIGLSAEFLVCQEICLPAEVELSLDLPVEVGGGTPDPAWADAFAATRARLPLTAPGWTAEAHPSDEGYDLVVSPPAGWDDPSTSFYFFVFDPTALDHDVPQRAAWRDGHLHVPLFRSSYNTGPATLDGVLARTDGGGFDTRGFRPALALAVPVEGDVARAGSAGGAAGVGGAASGLSGSAGTSVALAMALLLAFAGGVLLNLMPCVFPVLSLKILGFVRHAAGDARRTRLHGLAFGAGVVLSFLALAGVLLGVRAAGAQVGWGFQLQSPLVVAVLCLLVFAIGLGFAGVAEAGTSLTRLAGVAAGDERYRGSFLTGVLATVVATPCTAPFMGAAVGAALVRPAPQALAVFGVLGLGMATPYVVLSSWPALLRRMPRPGAWMETLKQALAFPMFAVSAWLVWVFGLQTGMNGAGALLAALVLVALAGWVVGRWPAATASRRALVASRAVAGVALVLAGLAVWRGVGSEEPRAVAASGSASVASAWEPFAEGVVDARLREGRPVFVDFTAAWCISCQVNERLVLSRDDILGAFRERDVALVKADWTRREPVITRALAAFGRSGVPLYVLYSPDPAAEPELLPAVLTTGIVLDALDRLGPTQAASAGAGPSNGGL